MRIYLLISLLTLIICVPAHAADISKSLVVIFGHEGGYVNDPIDPGGETKYGISKHSYPHEDIKHLTLKRAAWLYEQDFWNPLHLTELKSQGLATEVFDTAVNCGVGTSARIVQKVCNHLNGRGRDYPVDGRLTSETIRWLNFYTAEKSRRLQIYKLLNGYQLGRYIDIVDHNPKMEKYLKSWLSRVNW